MAQLLIVDDEEPPRRWAEGVLRENGYTCNGVSDADDARKRLDEGAFRLALLAGNLPGGSGMQLLGEIRREHPEVAVVMTTAEDSTELALRAIELGAFGYLVQPVGVGELVINVANALHRGRVEAQKQRIVRQLQDTVQVRSNALAQALQDLELSEKQVRASQAETIFRVARLVEFRDDVTGQHLHRMSSYCEILARKLSFSTVECERLRLASQLHDVGKVAIPDDVLLKPGKLTAEEFEIVKGHAAHGYEMLAGSASELVQLGGLIAYTHHERWDGGGYPRGLVGEEIPREGRVAAVADVFDALTSDRVHRPALPIKSALEIMRGQRGRCFDAKVLDAFFAVQSEIEAIREQYAD